MSETVMLPQHQLRAQLRAESFDETDSSIELVWSTGAAVLRYDWDGPYLETLDMTPSAVRLDRMNAGASFLNTHQSWDLDDVLGRVSPGTAKVAGGQGTCRVKLSTDPAKAGIVGDIRAGIIGNVSVGYLVHAMERTEATDGKTASCLVTDWEPFEISAVPVPADFKAIVRGASVEPTKHPCSVTRSAPERVEPVKKPLPLAATLARMRARRAALPA